MYFNFTSFKYLHSSPFISFQCILDDSGVHLSDLYNFYKLKRGDRISWEKPILQNGWIICSLILYFNFKSFKDPNSSSFTRFQCMLHDSGVLFADFWNFYKLKTGDLISCGEPILQKGWIISYAILYFNFKSFNTKILRHSLDFNVLCIISENFSPTFKIPTN